MCDFLCAKFFQKYSETQKKNILKKTGLRGTKF